MVVTFCVFGYFFFCFFFFFFGTTSYYVALASLELTVVCLPLTLSLPLSLESGD